MGKILQNYHCGPQWQYCDDIQYVHEMCIKANKHYPWTFMTLLYDAAIKSHLMTENLMSLRIAVNGKHCKHELRRSIVVGLLFLWVTSLAPAMSRLHFMRKSLYHWVEIAGDVFLIHVENWLSWGKSCLIISGLAGFRIAYAIPGLLSSWSSFLIPCWRQEESIGWWFWVCMCMWRRACKHDISRIVTLANIIHGVWVFHTV